MRRYLALLGLFVVIACDNATDNQNTASTDGAQVEAAVVNLYSSQQEHLIRPVLEQFTQETGIAVNLVTGGNAELVTKLEYEGEQTPADLLLTVDIGNVYQAKAKNLLQAVDSEVLRQNIPATLRDAEGYWYGLTSRARVIYYHKDRVSAEDAPKHYADLADPEWQGKLLIRSSDNVYNQSLLASIIAHEGEEAAAGWVKGLVANFARTPQGGDTDQLLALIAGEGDIAVANSYYFGRLLANPDRAEAAQKIAIVFPEQDGRGTHVNIRGGGVTKHAKNPQNARLLLEYLSSETAQRFFADGNLEYPSNPQVQPNDIVAAWGEFKRDALPLEQVGSHQRKAIAIMDEAGWR